VNKPTIAQFVLQVGGVFALVLSVILFTNHYFPVYTGAAVIGVSLTGLVALAIRERAKRRSKRNRRPSRTAR